MRFYGLVWLGLCLLVTPARAQAQTESPAVQSRLTFAVVIGNNKSLHARRPDLHYADDDAARYFQILQTMAPGRVSLLSTFDRDTGRLFPGVADQAQPATHGRLTELGKQLAIQVNAARRAGHETEVYFIFAGHGDVSQGEGFIELADQRFRSRELEAWLRAIPFTQAHVILDSCNSFFMLGVRKPGGRHFATSEDAARSLATRLPNVGVFLSTSAEGEAFEWSEIQSGIFSHVVRSGLLGGADANADGAVSYLELAAFVDTATDDVINPNMRPHVFARGPGAVDSAPIARLRSLTGVRRFTLEESATRRIRVRDANGLPLLDAHTEGKSVLQLAFPAAWVAGAMVERTLHDPIAPSGLASSRKKPSPPGRTSNTRLQLYAVPEAPEQITLASLQPLNARSAARGQAETFERLFARPFGPMAFARYLRERASRPPQVYGVTKEDTQRMLLVLGEIESAEHARRLAGGLALAGTGIIVGGTGIGVLRLKQEGATPKEKQETRDFAKILVGAGAAYAIGGGLMLAIPSDGEDAAREFRQVLATGGDPAQAFAIADERLQDLVSAERRWRWINGTVGGLLLAASGTGLVANELKTETLEELFIGRVGGGAVFLIGGVMLTNALVFETPAERLTKVWQQDPSLTNYRTTVSVRGDGAFLSLTGQF